MHLPKGCEPLIALHAVEEIIDEAEDAGFAPGRAERGIAAAIGFAHDACSSASLASSHSYSSVSTCDFRAA